ncbi:hypothetical protein BU17DRAFT_72067 [Hysterangium stoloniferum]|nr:hypothetical protein BU17DRAFT_72067 [Hysterangium stoloniferum]
MGRCTESSSSHNACKAGCEKEQTVNMRTKQTERKNALNLALDLVRTATSTGPFHPQALALPFANYHMAVVYDCGSMVPTASISLLHSNNHLQISSTNPPKPQVLNLWKRLWQVEEFFEGAICAYDYSDQYDPDPANSPSKSSPISSAAQVQAHAPTTCPRPPPILTPANAHLPNLSPSVRSLFPALSATTPPTVHTGEDPAVLTLTLLADTLMQQVQIMLGTREKRYGLLPLWFADRIRIRNSSSVFKVSLLQVKKDRGTVEVLWDGGQKREFKWGSIVWSSSGETGRKPTAEEIATNPVPLKPTPKYVAWTSSTVRCGPPAMLSAPIYDTSLAELFSLQTQLFQQLQQLGPEQEQGPGQISRPHLSNRSYQIRTDSFYPINLNAASTTATVSTSTTTKVPAIPASAVMSMPIPPTIIPLIPAQVQAYQMYCPPYFQPYALYKPQTQAQARPKPVRTAVPSFSVPLSAQSRGIGIGAAPYYPSSYAKLPLQPIPSASTSMGVSSSGMFGASSPGSLSSGPSCSSSLIMRSISPDISNGDESQKLTKADAHKLYDVTKAVGVLCKVCEKVSPTVPYMEMHLTEMHSDRIDMKAAVPQRQPKKPRGPRKNIAPKKGWKGWVEDGLEPQKLIMLDNPEVLPERTTRSGRKI